MNKNQTSVGPLDKVRLHIDAVPSQGNPSSERVSAEAVFIYGIGSEGITPFEKMLHAKSVGDEVTLAVTLGAEHLIFGHLHCSLAHAIGLSPPYALHIKVVSVAPAPSQDVVRAMAQAAGCGGGCGCGCGGH